MRTSTSVRAVVALVASVAVMVATIGLAANPSGASTLPVPYGAAAVTQALWNYTWSPNNVPGANNWNCSPSAAHPVSGRARTGHGRQRGGELGDPLTAARRRRLLRLLLQLRPDRPARAAGRPRRHRRLGPDDGHLREPGAGGDRRIAGRRGRPLAGRDDAELLHQVPRRRPRCTRSWPWPRPTTAPTASTGSSTLCRGAGLPRLRQSCSTIRPSPGLHEQEAGSTFHDTSSPAATPSPAPSTGSSRPTTTRSSPRTPTPS